MKIYDITQELFGCRVYPGDPMPERKIICSTKNGDLYNLTAFSMCAHNGTHIDAPFHFIENGKKVHEISLEKFVGPCHVFEFDGVLTAKDAENMFENADTKRILIKGDAEISLDAAKIFSKEEILLLGVESQSVGDENAPMAVHKELLKNEVVLLEGIRLNSVPAGKYFLSAAPLLLEGSDGSPCRALLIEFAQS